MKRIVVRIIFYLSAIPLVLIAITIIPFLFATSSPPKNLPYVVSPLTEMATRCYWNTMHFLVAPQHFFMSEDRFPIIYYFPAILVYIFVFVTSGLLILLEKIKSRKPTNY
jgi:hypothetical protein